MQQFSVNTIKLPIACAPIILSIVYIVICLSYKVLKILHAYQ